MGVPIAVRSYDGDTPQSLRRKLRDGGNVVLTNPDMLHQGILPNHSRWHRFFTQLRYVVSVFSDICRRRISRRMRSDKGRPDVSSALRRAESRVLPRNW